MIISPQNTKATALPRLSTISDICSVKRRGMDAVSADFLETVKGWEDAEVQF